MPHQVPGEESQEHKCLPEPVDMPGQAEEEEGTLTPQAAHTCCSCLPSFHTFAPENRSVCYGWG